MNGVTIKTMKGILKESFNMYSKRIKTLKATDENNEEFHSRSHLEKSCAPLR